jgi:hypothetical protein
MVMPMPVAVAPEWDMSLPVMPVWVMPVMIVVVRRHAADHATGRPIRKSHNFPAVMANW